MASSIDKRLLLSCGHSKETDSYCGIESFWCDFCDEFRLKYPYSKMVETMSFPVPDGFRKRLWLCCGHSMQGEAENVYDFTSRGYMLCLFCSKKSHEVHVTREPVDYQVTLREPVKRVVKRDHTC